MIYHLAIVSVVYHFMVFPICLLDSVTVFDCHVAMHREDNAK